MNSGNKITALYFIRMGCPACATHALPQAALIHRHFAGVRVAAFHAACPAADLRAYLDEHAAGVPGVIDEAAFTRYAVQGTPTLLLLDRQGRRRRQTAGPVPDLLLGAELMSLLREEPLS